MNVHEPWEDQGIFDQRVRGFDRLGREPAVYNVDRLLDTVGQHGSLYKKRVHPISSQPALVLSVPLGVTS